MSLDSFIDRYQKYFLRDGVCRFCSNKHATISLQSSPETENEVNLLLDNIKFCLGIELQLENEPKTICELCKDKIEHFAYFKKLCLESEESLQRLIKTEDTEIDTKLLSPSDCVEVEICGDLNVNDESIECLDLNTDSCHSTGKSASNDDCEDDILATEPTLNEKEALESDKSTTNIPKLKKKKYKPKKTTTYCNICHVDSKTARNLIEHNFQYHGVGRDGRYNCFGCDRRFENPKARASHETKSCKGLKEGFKCTLCDRFLPRRGVYETHMKNHRNNGNVALPENVFECSKCPASFKNRDSLKKHLESHEVKKTYICETCGREFARQVYLGIHMKTHTGDRQHKCPHCNYRATQRSALTVHIRKHTGERPFSCNICSQRCVNRSNLTKHLKSHEGVKNFECTICQKRFSYKGSLDDHIASIHENTFQHTCVLCSAIYVTKSALRRHLLQKHRKKLRKSILVEADSETDKDVLIKMTREHGMEFSEDVEYEIDEDQMLVVQSEESE